MNKKDNIQDVPSTDNEEVKTPEETDPQTPDAANESIESNEGESVLKAIRTLTADEDNTPTQTAHSKITLASILGGDILGGKWFRRQFWFIVMIVAMVIVYVSNRYSCQQEMIQTKMLTDTLLDRRYKALTRSSQLKEKMRRSVIEGSLADTTLQTANTPLFKVQVDDE